MLMVHFWSVHLANDFNFANDRQCIPDYPINRLQGMLKSRQLFLISFAGFLWGLGERECILLPGQAINMIISQFNCHCNNVNNNNNNNKSWSHRAAACPQRPKRPGAKSSSASSIVWNRSRNRFGLECDCEIWIRSLPPSPSRCPHCDVCWCNLLAVVVVVVIAFEIESL